jgi:hypothetical protein
MYFISFTAARKYNPRNCSQMFSFVFYKLYDLAELFGPCLSIYKMGIVKRLP